jgi:pantoate--beta-alanine ligase
MRVFTEFAEVKSATRKEKAEGRRVGLVPTMGFLHEGHLSLVRESVRRTDYTVVSLFVNPTQFGPHEDFKEYPRDLDRDKEALERLGVNLLFAPYEKEMYPKGYKTFVEVTDLQDKLCGRSRPGHFRGVCTVVLKLLEIVDPDEAFFGQKDAQQALILKKMARDLNLDVDISVLPIVRDEDGLALSSRNIYLKGKQRKAALCLVKSLREAEELLEAGERGAAAILRKMKQVIDSEPLAKIDYIEIVDLANLEPLDKIEKEALIALAVFIGNVRLIDNMMIQIKE